MDWMSNELLARVHYEYLLQEAEQERQALQLKNMGQRSLQHDAIYLIGSSLIHLGQRLERFGAPHTANY
jgi:hypothetical protein